MIEKRFEVLCDNKGSFQIALVSQGFKPKYGKPVILIRCDRLDTEDNTRGSMLADRICAFMNTFSEAERDVLLANEMMPPVG